MNRMVIITGFTSLLIGSALFLGSEMYQQKDIQVRLEAQQQKNRSDKAMIKTFRNFQSGSKQVNPAFSKTEKQAQRVISLGIDYANNQAKGDSKELKKIDSNFKNIATPDVIMAIKRQFIVPADVSEDWKIPVNDVSIKPELSTFSGENQQDLLGAKIFGTFSEFEKNMYFQADYDFNQNKFTYINFFDLEKGNEGVRFKDVN